MKIQFVPEPNPHWKGCLGGYDSQTKTLVIRRHMLKIHTSITIIHEFFHYLIDLFFIFDSLKHYSNQTYDNLWIVFFKPINRIQPCLIAVNKYYNNALKEGSYVK